MASLTWKDAPRPAGVGRNHGPVTASRSVKIAAGTQQLEKEHNEWGHHGRGLLSTRDGSRQQSICNIEQMQENRFGRSSMQLSRAASGTRVELERIDSKEAHRALCCETLAQ